MSRKNPRVEIRDSKNVDRVLGSMPRPALSHSTHDRFNVAYMPRVAASVGPFESLSEIPTARYTTFAIRRHEWEVVVVTEAPLEVLAKMDGFRFPGETEEAAGARRWHWG